MGRLDSLRVVDPVLTTIARGYKNEELVGDLLFPVVEVTKEGGKIPIWGKEAFKIYNTKRAPRANSNRMNPEDRTTIDFVIEEHDLEYPIDYREKEEDIFASEKHATKVVTDALALQKEYEQAMIAQDLANYPTGNKVTLTGTSQFTDSSSDPIGVVEDGKKAISDKIGRDPNLLVIGDPTFRTLRNHPQLVEKIKYSMKGVLTLDLLREIFDIDKIVVGKAVSADDNGNFVKIWSDNMILAYVPQVETEEDPAFGLTLRKKGYPKIDKYFSNGGKIEYVRNTDFWTVKLVGAVAGYLIKDTNA